MVVSGDSPDRPARIRVVDDEPTVREMVGLNLRAAGYDVAFAARGDDALTVAREANPDLIVLDVMLPGRDGLEVVRILRAESSVPILLLSARGEEMDRVIGLEVGADDYLTKPFAMRELVARVRAMLRRRRMSPAEAPGGRDPSADALTVGDVTIDPDRHEATVRGEPLTLTAKEFGLLAYLARHPGIVLTREALLREVWGYDHPMDTRTVDVHISALRQKLEEDPAQPRRILTVRGRGYRLVAAGDPPAKDAR
jgi:two-component system alkaline phosphatase synthesis response regulator PhoP